MDSPSSSNQTPSVQDELENFREKWHKELKISSLKDKDNSTKNVRCEKESDIENEARKLFSKGADMENRGKFYEAIQLYRKAIQLVPDIEYKIHLSSKTAKDEKKSSKVAEENIEMKKPATKVKVASDDEKSKKCDLLSRIQKKMRNASAICTPLNEQKTTHFSSLPVEIVLHILKWVVSSELDLRSFEMFGQVCRGFYICARDSEIWKLACFKVWGVGCAENLKNFGSWRSMFLNRIRVLFNGCYISKTTYIRPGESSFQDLSYRPWHLVSYYRYFRFFPDGKVLMLTSANDPSKCVSLLRQYHSKSPVLSGYFRIKDDHVEIIIHRPKNPVSYNAKQNSNMELHSSSDQTVCMEFQVINHRNRRNVNLQWTHYSIKTKAKMGEENVCIFDLDNKKFSPLWFSRVKSYTTESENILI